MTEPKRRRGGWSGDDKAKQPGDYTIRYGHGLLKEESAQWPRYIAVTSPSALQAAGPYLSQEPSATGFVRSLEWAFMEELTDSIGEDAELVVGLGGGRVLDVSKFVALKKELPLVIVPSIVSTGAIVHGRIPRLAGRKLAPGPGKGMAWIDFEDILVDYDLVLGAPGYLNTAGLGDILCNYAGVAEWRRNAGRGVGPPVDQALVGNVERYHQELADRFPTTLAADGSLSPDSIVVIMKGLQDRADKMLEHPAAWSADHPFINCIQLVNDKDWVHGELAAMGALIVAWHCGVGPEALAARLDACGVRRRPRDMGVSREELRKTLERAPDYMAERSIETVLQEEPITGSRFDALWGYLETE